jgi:hypothetical protein
LDIKESVNKNDKYPACCVGYGHWCVLKYVNKEDGANMARRNADSYSLFALAAYYGIDKFQTDWEKLEPQCNNL